MSDTHGIEEHACKRIRKGEQLHKCQCSDFSPGLSHGGLDNQTCWLSGDSCAHQAK